MAGSLESRLGNLEELCIIIIIIILGGGRWPGHGDRSEIAPPLTHPVWRP